MNSLVPGTQLRPHGSGPRHRSTRYLLRLAHVLLLGFVVTIPTAAAIEADEPSQSKEKITSPPTKKKEPQSPVPKGKSDKSKTETKGSAGDSPIRRPSAPAPQAPPANNDAVAMAPATPPPPSFGQLDPGQGALTSRSSVPAFFGDFFEPGGSVLNVPGTPLHATATSPDTTPLALGFASVSVQGTSSPDQLYFRSVVGAPPPFNAFGTFLKAPGTDGYVYRTNSPGINFASPPAQSTYQLTTIPPQSTNPVGYYVSIPATQVTPSNGSSFSGESGILKNATPTLTNGQQVNDVIAVGSPLTKFGTGQTALTKIYGFFNDTPQTGYHAQPLVFTGAGASVKIPILFVLTTNTSPNVYSPSAAAGGVQKLVDNASPLPRDRVFFNYSYFDHSAIVVDGHEIDVNRMTPGFEKTFFDQQMSVEVRVPFATMIDNINLTGTTNTGNIMLGNQTTYLKALLYTDSNLAISSGFGVQAPTAASTNYTVNGYSINAGNGAYTQLAPIDVLKIKNEAVHLLPYIGAVFTPNDRFYAQSVAQLDFSTNGNTVYNAAVYPSLDSTNSDPNKWTVTSATTGLSRAGSLNDTNFMYLSANAGYWMYKIRNPYERGLTGFAPTAELHYNQSLQRGDTVSGFYGNPGTGVGNISQVNAVIGANAVIGHDKYLSAAYVVPFGTGVDRAFDGELRVMFNYYFGAPRVNPRFSNVPGI